jgi:hypothetical protein
MFDSCIFLGRRELWGFTVLWFVIVQLLPERSLIDGWMGGWMGDG